MRLRAGPTNDDVDFLASDRLYFPDGDQCDDHIGGQGVGNGRHFVVISRVGYEARPIVLCCFDFFSVIQ